MWRIHNLLDMYDAYDDMFMFGGGGDMHPRAFGAPVSKRALDACERAKAIFLEFLATADTSAGDATQEIIQFHLVGDMQKAFGKFVREHGCRPKSRKLTREEQDKINKSRQSLMTYTSVTVNAAAQAKYARENPKEAEAARAKHPAAKVKAPVASGSRPLAAAVTKAPLATTAKTATASGSRAPLATKKRNLQDAGIAGSGGEAKKAKTGSE